VFNLKKALEIELQKKKNKVAKSAWKFSITDTLELYRYNKEFKLLTKNRGRQSVGLVKNSFMINSINYTFKYKAHIGNWIINKKFYKLAIGLKMREFLKFKKPFHYISKKKKKK
jgi:hypothetical protein